MNSKQRRRLVRKVIDIETTVGNLVAQRLAGHALGPFYGKMAMRDPRALYIAAKYVRHQPEEAYKNAYFISPIPGSASVT